MGDFNMIDDISGGQMSELRLLYVDSAESNHMIFEAMFEHSGIDYDMASSGEQAVRKCLDAQYDIVLMDCFTDDIDGFVATKMIRDNERAEMLEPALVFALKDELTAVSQVKALDVGMDGVLLKPMTIKMFKELMMKWFAAPEVVAEDQPTPQGGLAEKLIDTHIALSLKDVLKDKYGATVDLFKQDIQFYVDDAYLGVENEDLQKIHQAMHTVKSASMQMGLVKVSELAAQLEDLCYADNTAMQPHLLCDIIRAQVDHIQHVYTLSEGMLEKTKY
jgi:CheY-like chemotaxis protein